LSRFVHTVIVKFYKPLKNKGVLKIHTHEVTGSSPVVPFPINNLQARFSLGWLFFALGATGCHRNDGVCLTHGVNAQ
jgi:hypothetical protein